jgi:hypothetical protein
MAVSAVKMELWPSDLSRRSLTGLLEDVRSRENLLQTQIQRYERQYAQTLEELEERLDRGEGSEHPDWEDSIAWRNSLEVLHRQSQLRSLLEWTLRSTSPLLNS